MAFERKFPAAAIATAVYVGSGPVTPLLALASNGNRAQAKLQGADAFYVGVDPSMTASSALFYASGGIHDEQFHTGPLYVRPGSATGATAAIRTWESSQ